MTGIDPLAALHPLRSAPAIGLWPPAPGWWFLLGLCLVCLLVLAVSITRWYRRNAYRRRAAARLEALRAASGDENPPTHYTEQVNVLLKSVALHAYPNAGVAALHGQAWVNFLNEKIRREPKFQADYVTAMYSNAPPSLSSGELYALAHHWIKRHEVVR